MRIDAVQTIKDRLTMRDVLEKYGYTVKRRIPCPLHNGDDDNFEVKEKTYCCHSHCGSGDVITFVQKLFNLSFPETLRKIDADFCLNIYGDHTFEELRQSHYKEKMLKAKKDREQREKQRENDNYWKVFDEYKRLDDNFNKYKPKTQQEELHPLFIEALHNLEHQKFIFECLEQKRCKNV